MPELSSGSLIYSRKGTSPQYQNRYLNLVWYCQYLSNSKLSTNSETAMLSNIQANMPHDSSENPSNQPHGPRGSQWLTYWPPWTPKHTPWPHWTLKIICSAFLIIRGLIKCRHWPTGTHLTLPLTSWTPHLTPWDKFVLRFFNLYYDGPLSSYHLFLLDFTVYPRSCVIVNITQPLNLMSHHSLCWKVTFLCFLLFFVLILHITKYCVSNWPIKSFMISSD